jgi:hypothetical protein
MASGEDRQIMSRLELSRTSKIPPDPWHVEHGGTFKPGYTCHMAALHWAQMMLGSNQRGANRIVGAFAKEHCPGCTGNGLHGSLSPSAYGKLFCQEAQLIPTADDLYDLVDVGDVLITGDPKWPAHTMILRQKRGRDHVTIRGFNNHGTLGTGIRDRYDPVSHNITQRKYWRDAAAGKFGSIGVPLFVISYDRFITASSLLRNKYR